MAGKLGCRRMCVVVAILGTLVALSSYCIKVLKLENYDSVSSPRKIYSKRDFLFAQQELFNEEYELYLPGSKAPFGQEKNINDGGRPHKATKYRDLEEPGKEIDNLLRQLLVTHGPPPMTPPPVIRVHHLKPQEYINSDSQSALTRNRHRKTIISHGDRADVRTEESHLGQSFVDDGYVRDCLTGDVLYKWRTSNQSSLLPFGRLVQASEFQEESYEHRKTSFRNVYKSRAWGHSWDKSVPLVNVSGRGSTLEWAQEVTGSLHVLLNFIKHRTGKKIIKILDVPCGDMAWMNRFLKSRDDIDYTGIDIVAQLVKSHAKIYRGNSRVRFISADVLWNNISVSDYDLIFNRMMTQHLFHSDVIRLLRKFSQSGSSYLLTTTFSRHSKNQELLINKSNTGRFRMLNLELPPFSLPPPLCLHRDGPPDDVDGKEHYIGLWGLPLSSITNCTTHLHIIEEKPDLWVYSCA